MATFTMGVPAGLAYDSTVSAALGVNAAGKLTSADLGKAVKLLADSTYGVCAATNDIEGVLIAVESHTVNDGFGLGTVQTKERVVAIAKGGVLAIGAYVVAAAQAAIGTANTVVASGTQKGTYGPYVQAGAGVAFKWRVVAHFGGAGAVDTPILIERVN